MRVIRLSPLAVHSGVAPGPGRHHRAEFEDAEEFSMKADSVLTEQHLSVSLDQDGERSQQHHR
jgi:hypothetical protein